MPNLTFIVFELLVYALFGLCLAHAWKQGWAAVLRLAAGALFGLLLEWATIQQLQAYEYGRFLLMLGPVPVAIGVAWGTIIYSVQTYSNATSLPEWARPALDALLALNLDLSMDALAIRLGFWDWGIAINREYFGVPYANFWAWFWVVFSFSAGLRLLARWQHPLGKGLAPFGAILIGVAGVLATNRLIVNLSNSYSLYLAVIAVTIGAALVLVVVLRPRLVTQPEVWVATVVPAAFHIYYLAAGLLTGVIFQPPFLLVVSLLMGLVALFLHARTPQPAAVEAV